MVNLTQPAILCFGKIPQDINLRHHFLQIVSYLQAYKEVSWEVLSSPCPIVWGNNRITRK